MYLPHEGGEVFFLPLCTLKLPQVVTGKFRQRGGGLLLFIQSLSAASQVLNRSRSATKKSLQKFFVLPFLCKNSPKL